jgi:hypothetical protein
MAEAERHDERRNAARAQDADQASARGDAAPTSEMSGRIAALG